MKIACRPAQEGDFEIARRIHHTAYRSWVIDQFGPWNDETQDRFFRESWEQWPYEMIEIDGIPCGYIAFEDAEDATHIREFAIQEECQGRGIGTGQLRRLIDRSEIHQKPLKLRAFKKNASAQKLYRRLGFIETGETELQIEFEWPLSSSTNKTK